MNAHTKRIVRKILSPISRIGLKNRSFSIISNNCWGGYVYDLFGLEYKTPTIGLYFFAKEFIKFISNLEYYLGIDAAPLDVNNSRYKDELLKRGHTMLGHVDDVEFVFIHYSSASQGCEKWNRRKNRVRFDNLLIKFNDQNLFSPSDYWAFRSLEFCNKLFFTANSSYANEAFSICFKEYKKAGFVADDIKTSKKHVNFKNLLNNLNGGK